MMYRKILQSAAVFLVLVGCDSDAPDDSVDSPSPPIPGMAAAHDDGENSRLVSVYLQSEPNNGFIPMYVDRVVVAEPVIVVPTSRAEGKAIVSDIDTTIIGGSCDELVSKYPSLSSCIEVETVEFQYGEPEYTAVTDREGFAALFLGGHDKYRVRVQSWATAEDNQCYWGGSEILEANLSSMGIPVLVFCE